jgi:hypothetical protein
MQSKDDQEPATSGLHEWTRTKQSPVVVVGGSATHTLGPVSVYRSEVSEHAPFFSVCIGVIEDDDLIAGSTGRDERVARLSSGRTRRPSRSGIISGDVAGFGHWLESRAPAACNALTRATSSTPGSAGVASNDRNGFTVCGLDL